MQVDLEARLKRLMFFRVVMVTTLLFIATYFERFGAGPQAEYRFVQAGLFPNFPQRLLQWIRVLEVATYRRPAALVTSHPVAAAHQQYPAPMPKERGHHGRSAQLGRRLRH